MPKLRIYHVGYLGFLSFSGLFLDPRLWGLALFSGFFVLAPYPKGFEPQLKRWQLFLFILPAIIGYFSWLFGIYFLLLLMPPVVIAAIIPFIKYAVGKPKN